MNFIKAKQIFKEYLQDYDCTNDKVRLKIIHTYGVVSQSTEIARRMHLSEEDTQLAQYIALLHDIGRFEQLKRFDSFEPGTMDHAAYGVQVLFEENMIRRFIPEHDWDDIIRISIEKHSDYQLEGIADERTLLHAKLIRDADKLDNCRVKLDDDPEAFMGFKADEIGMQDISPAIYNTVFDNRCILSEDRITAMDYWCAYIAYFYDINFKESMEIIVENDYLSRIVHRISYPNPRTARQMQEIEQHVQTYMQQFLEK